MFFLPYKENFYRMGVILKKSLIIVFILAVFSGILFSVAIDSSVAQSVAQFHWDVHNSASSRAVRVDPLKSKSGAVLAYVVSFEPKGFVVVASDTDIYPIVAYSFTDKFSFNNVPQNALLQIIQKDMENLLANKGKLNNISNNKVWTHYRNKDKNYFTSNRLKQWPPKGATSTDGWITTRWTEVAPYNKKCPKDPNTGIRTNAGSVSVALAQIFNYFHYLPKVTFNSSDSYQTLNGINIDSDAKKYDFPAFSELNNNLSNIQSKLLANINLNKTDAAYLIFACALAVNMHFSSETPDSWTWDVLNATKNKFKYTSAKLYYTDNDSFFIHLKKNLKNRLPVNIDFNDNFEHSIICDGYNNQGFYHLNTGWNEKNKSSITAWYHISKENKDIIAQSIMYFKKSYSTPTAQLKKIELPTDILGQTLVENEETVQDTTKKTDIKQELLEAAIEKEDIAPVQQRQMFYEEPPVPIKQVAPRYPRLLKKLGIEGTVILFVEIKSDGTVGEVEVKKSLKAGKGGLDEAAIKAVKKWKFEPAKNAGKPITVWVNLPITFTLH